MPVFNRPNLILMITTLVLASTLLANSSATLEFDQCLETRLVLRDVTIADGSGRWSHQDVLIENGRFTAMGRELTIESETVVTEVPATGAVISPLVERDVILIRASFDDDAPVLMVGEDADFSMLTQDGAHLADFRRGQPVGQCGF